MSYRSVGLDQPIRHLDVVALTKPLADQGLSQGQVGTVVESLEAGVYEVEFADDQGRCYTTAAVPAERLLVLHYQPVSSERA
jgi:hypothetical protein